MGVRLLPHTHAGFASRSIEYPSERPDLATEEIPDPSQDLLAVVASENDVARHEHPAGRRRVGHRHVGYDDVSEGGLPLHERPLMSEFLDPPGTTTGEKKDHGYEELDEDNGVRHSTTHVEALDDDRCAVCVQFRRTAGDL